MPKLLKLNNFNSASNDKQSPSLNLNNEGLTEEECMEIKLTAAIASGMFKNEINNSRSFTSV